LANSGLQTSQRAGGGSFIGTNDGKKLTLNERISGWFAFLTSSSALFESRTGQFMFDWPEQSQTSPNSTFLSVAFCLVPAMLRVCGPPAVNGPTFVIHLPSLPAIAILPESLPSTVMAIVSPGALQPQMGA
jgi:hypothetical protein